MSRLIMHLDGDAFFVSVETAKNPKFRGKPVVTGRERGIASALSYEAKALGITRAMPIFQIRREFPQVAVIDSDYESYAVFSRRMMDIVRRYTDSVEEYSIDECFADFSHIKGFEENARKTLEDIKGAIKKELGISVSLGLAPTKVLAKVASKKGKPDGLTIVSESGAPALLDKTPVDKVWGIGSATAFALRKKGVSTALELARKPLPWVEEHFSKPMAAMWHELNCHSVLPIRDMSSEAQKSIMKTRTFVPASNDRSYVFSELSKNIENACRKARELGLSAREFSMYLKTRDFGYISATAKLAYPTESAFTMIAEARKLFDSLYDPEKLYRATGVTLHALMPALMRQDDLFGTASRGEEQVFAAVDKVNRKYGWNIIRVASSSRAFAREEREERTIDAGKGIFVPKGFSRRLSVPYLGVAR